ncbi:MAG TPA: hypothetical protein EYQ24_13680, partial [Bacteroidetes bacterium]|nr:hypothetical protein [Bacteroidota bacterium]
MNDEELRGYYADAPLLGWIEWARWRKTRRPPGASEWAGPGKGIEATLWRRVMELVHGEAWRELLAARDDDDDEPEGPAAAAPPAAEPGAAMPLVAAHEAEGGAPAPGVADPFAALRPGEAVEDFESRLRAGVEQMRARGEPVDDVEVEATILRARYAREAEARESPALWVLGELAGAVASDESTPLEAVRRQVLAALAEELGGEVAGNAARTMLA